MRKIRALRHIPHRTVLVLAALAAVLGILLAGHSAASAAPSVSVRPSATVSHGSTANHGAANHGAANHGAANHGAATGPVNAVTTAAVQPGDEPGICSVPGIGDIAGLFDFCQRGNSGLTGDLNNICQPSTPEPEPASSGIDAIVRPPASAGNQPPTLYGSYGVAGQYWAATNLQCSDMTSLIGNNVASMVFDIAKSIDRVTITVYQSAAGDGILGWLTSVVNKLISSLGSAIYFPYLSAVVILGAIWLAWQGLIRKRATRTIEGTIWMVVAAAAAIWLIGRPADFTGAGSAVSNGMSQALNVAFAKLPSTGDGNCLPTSNKDPQVPAGNFNFQSSSGVVDQNANELWTVLVCKPWLAGEFGTTAFGPANAKTPVNTYARQLLWAQAIATNEKPTNALIQSKQDTYNGIAASMQQHDPSIYPLFQGKQWTTRLEIAFAALFAAAIAGVLVLLIAVTLILLKLGFLLLLVAGPFFLLIGTHPGFGRVVALRWFEMLVGVLLKQAAVALVLSVLLYAYSLIMGTSDQVLGWALKILMIALVTIAVFIYRKPFQHLFSAVGYGMIGSRERAEIDFERSRATLRTNTIGAAAAAAGGVAAYRAARWARRNPGQATALGGSGHGAGSAAATGAGLQTIDGTSLDGEDGYALADGTQADGGGTRAGGRAGLASRARARGGAEVSDDHGRTAPPLNLPSREAAGSGQGGWARNGGVAPGTMTPGRTAADAAAASAAGGPVRPAQPAAGPARSAPAAPADPARPGGAGPWPTRSSYHPQAGSTGRPPSGPAPGGPASSPPRPAPARPSSASRGSAGSAPSGPAPASPSPSAPAGSGSAPAPPRAADSGSPWRRGVTPRPAQARPPASPEPRGPAGRGESGPWADSSAGRQSPPPPRPPAPAAGRPPGSQPPPRPSAPPVRQASVRQASVRQTAAPAARPPARDAGPPPDLPLAGRPDEDEPAGPTPFWLRSIRRRK